MESFIGTIMPVAFNFAPRGWATCSGQVMSISQNTALFSLLGTQYGGDGITTFSLPDLRGRVAVGQGSGPGISPVELGEVSGTNSTTTTLTGAGVATLSAVNLPSHNHAATFTGTGATPLAITINTSSTQGNSVSPTPGSYLGAIKMSGPGATASLYVPGPATATVPLGAGSATSTGTSGGITGGTVAVSNTGSGQALNIPVTVSGQTSVMQPFTGLNYIICLEGIFPSRN